VRNRITVRAFAELGRPGEVKGLFDGPTAIMDGEDPVSMAKAAVAFAKRSDKLEVKGGLVEGQVLTAAEVRRLSAMPNRHEMRAQLLGLVIGVGGRLAAALTAPGGRIAGALEAMAEKENGEPPQEDKPQAA
jgi:large subunit ribosomal protein L10